MLHEQFDRFFQTFRRDAHPMAIMVGAVGALSAFYHDSTNVHDEKQRQISAHRMIAKMPTIAARAFKYAVGQPFVYPRNELGYADNFLRMCFAVPAEDYKVNQVLAKAMDKIFILHADHEQNASTSTVRLAGSSGANPFACIAAGIACLWGPSHGGANEEALNMLKEIGTVDRIPEYVQGVKDRRYRLMGFGHRVYKNYDPRAKVMQKTCHEVLDALGKRDEPLLQVAMELERIALSDPYFVERKLYPNIDFYSGITLSAMGFPSEMFTVLFALARTVGWIAQWKEMIEDRSSAAGLHRSGPTLLRANRQAIKGRQSVGNGARPTCSEILRPLGGIVRRAQSILSLEIAQYGEGGALGRVALSPAHKPQRGVLISYLIGPATRILKQRRQALGETFPGAVRLQPLRRDFLIRGNVEQGDELCPHQAPQDRIGQIPDPVADDHGGAAEGQLRRHRPARRQSSRTARHGVVLQVIILDEDHGRGPARHSRLDLLPDRTRDGHHYRQAWCRRAEPGGGLTERFGESCDFGRSTTWKNEQDGLILSESQGGPRPRTVDLA